MQITRLLLFFAFLLLSGKIFAQGTVDPRSFPDSNFSWNETYVERIYEVNIYNSYDITYYDAGDTLVNNIHYRKLNMISVFTDFDWMDTWPNYEYIVGIENSNELFGLLRNDKPNKKVYIKNIYNDDEYILFDFGLKLKDKVTMNFFPEFEQLDYYIVRVDSVLDPNGVTRKFFKYSINLADTNLNSGEWYQTIIEGIGMSNGIYSQKIYIPFEYITLNLNCIKLDSNRIYKINTGWWTHSSNVSIDTTASCNFTEFQYMGIDDTKIKSITIYPNPADNFIHFNIDNEIELLEIYDSKLTLIKSSTQLRNKFLDISQLPSGIYFCKVYSKGKYYSGKFLRK